MPIPIIIPILALAGAAGAGAAIGGATARKNAPPAGASPTITKVYGDYVVPESKPAPALVKDDPTSLLPGVDDDMLLVGGALLLGSVVLALALR